MMICNDCRSTFDEPIWAAEDDGLDCPPYRYTQLCPRCYSNDIDDCYECERCGDLISADDTIMILGVCLCRECAAAKELDEE